MIRQRVSCSVADVASRSVVLLRLHGVFKKHLWLYVARPRRSRSTRGRGLEGVCFRFRRLSSSVSITWFDALMFVSISVQLSAKARNAISLINEGK